MRACFSILGMLAAASASAQVAPQDFLDGSVREFAQRTEYRLAGPNETDAEHPAVHASCRDEEASALVVKRKTSLEDTPILKWRWRVDSIYKDTDETEKSGDDFPARVYVVAERWPRFRSRVINYVWSSSQTEGETWESPFASQFRMVAMQSGEKKLGRWITEQRDVLADFRHLHGMEPDTVDALAIMTDCDNTGQQATAWYGPAQWLPEDHEKVRPSDADTAQTSAGQAGIGAMPPNGMKQVKAPRR